MIKEIVSNLKEIFRSTCLSFSDFKILYRNLSKRLCNGNKEAETSQGIGEISLFLLNAKDREMESYSGETHSRDWCTCLLCAGIALQEPLL